jgi:NADH-quinone oxidoreductase subunit J
MAAFVVFGAIAVAAALGVVLSRNAVVSALWLALTLVATAGVFLVLGAEFLAIIQIVVYAGAIVVFFLFVVMLVSGGRPELGEQGRWLHRYLSWLAVPALFMLLAFVFTIAGRELQPAATVAGKTRDLAALLFSRYLAPFELASVLLLVAMVGAVALAKKRS